MTRTLTALLTGAALAALAAPALAEELRGRVTDSFGAQVVIEARGARYLVILPPGVEAPAEGARIRAEGALEGRTLTARSLALDAGPGAGPRDGARAEDRGPRHGSRGEGPRGAGAPLAASPAAEAPRLPGVGDLALVETSRSGDRHWAGRLADGSVLRVVTDAQGRLERLATEGAALPRPLIDRLLPVRLSALAQADRLAAITRAELRPRGEIVLRGPDAEGHETELRYDRAGRFERAERRLPPPGLDRAEVARILTQAGYTDIAGYDFGPAHAEAVATNPWGERVEVRINRHGEIDRERRRDG
jgi:hypothetical protein